jgi:hypothetical protein
MSPLPNFVVNLVVKVFETAIFTGALIRSPLLLTESIESLVRQQDEREVGPQRRTLVAQHTRDESVLRIPLSIRAANGGGILRPLS